MCGKSSRSSASLPVAERPQPGQAPAPFRLVGRVKAALLAIAALALVTLGVRPASAFDGILPPTYGITLDVVLDKVETALTAVMLPMVVFMIGLGVIWFVIGYARRTASGNG